MKNLAKLLTSIAILFCTIHIQAENPCGIMYPVHDSTSWGIGFIRMPINNIAALKGIAENTKKECYIANGEIRFLNENFPRVNENDFVYCGGYDFILLKVYQVKDTKYKVCTRSIDGGIWVDFDE